MVLLPQKNIEFYAANDSRREDQSNPSVDFRTPKHMGWLGYRGIEERIYKKEKKEGKSNSCL
jgi:hypothetical protein